MDLDDLWERVRVTAERVYRVGDYMFRRIVFEVGRVEGVEAYDNVMVSVLYGSGVGEYFTGVPDEPFDGAEEFFYSKVFPLFMDKGEREQMNKIMLSSSIAGGDVMKEVDAYIRGLARKEVVVGGTPMLRGLYVAKQCRDWRNAFQIAYMIVKNELGV